MASQNLRIQPGSTILVTGANGFVGSHVVNEILKHGYKVRGCTRNATRDAWMSELFGSNFEIFEVKDFAAKDAYKDAIRGVFGVAHVASNVYESPDPNVVIPAAKANIVNMLETASKEQSVKAVTYCSSQAAVFFNILNKPYTVDENTWNDEAVQLAWRDEPYDKDPARAGQVYAASKVEAEKAALEWVKENKPHFVYNAVLPNCNFGEILSIKGQGYRSSALMMYLLWNGNAMGAHMVPPCWYVDPVDTGLIHLASLIYEDVKDERLFAFGEQFTWQAIQDVFRKEYPDRKFDAQIPDMGKDIGKVPNERAAELLKRLGKNGFSTLEEGVKKGAAQIVQLENEGYKLNITGSSKDIAAAMGITA